jgi:hypothetical protein
MLTLIRDTEITNISFSTALMGALLRCPSLMRPATLRSWHLALHPASTVKYGILATSPSLRDKELSAIATPWVE